MDRFRRRSKKEKPQKHADREKSPLFITDVKTIKENLKIKEILRTVKMNSSMRIKAPKGSKVMQNKDFNDNEDIFEVDKNTEEHNISETTSAINPDVVVNYNHTELRDEVTQNCAVDDTIDDGVEKSISVSNILIDTTLHESRSMPEGISDPTLISNELVQNVSVVPDVKIDVPPQGESSPVRTRDRKLSLDQTMLSRREGLSQSELDLNSIGKSPLERKSSFFRKKMDSFLRNTTEMFKRQTSKTQSIQRRGSMSVSLQSLNENSTYNADFEAGLLHNHQEELHGSTASLSSLTPALSNSSLSMCQSERTPDVMSETNSLAGSRPVLTTSQPLEVMTSDSVHSLNEVYIQESLLHSRAISMSSGLDSAHGPNRRKNRSNRPALTHSETTMRRCIGPEERLSVTLRVTWLASEGLTNYLRRIIQDENNSEIQPSHSYQDFSTIPQNNHYGSKMDSKGRRLSYQRAVSGEDPRYHDSSVRRRNQMPDCSEACKELAAYLEEFQQEGLPALQGFQIASIAEKAFAFLYWAGKEKNLNEFYDWKQLTPYEEARQTMIREFIYTEADYIRHLVAIVEVFMATAHAIQDMGMMLDVETSRLFSNIPDVLNASLHFWEATVYPMLLDATNNHTPFNTELMSPGFCRFHDIFYPYEKFVLQQTKSLDYLRSLNNHAIFMTYLTWCHSQQACNRLQLADIMVKPMQRITKYSLILRRITNHTDMEPERTNLRAMENFTTSFVTDINRTIRQREEMDKVDNLDTSIEPYEPEFKDEDMERCFRLHSSVNLKAPMPNCNRNHSRTLIHQSDLRYRDNAKEFEARIFLLTDMLLVCKKISTKGNHPTYKLTRPKYFVDKLIIYPKFARNGKDITQLVLVALDEVGSSYVTFALTDVGKEYVALRIWEQKLREAKLTYEYAVYYSRNPSRDITELDIDSSSEYSTLPTTAKAKAISEDLNIERLARERAAVMMHRGMGASTEHDYSQGSMATDSFDGDPMSFATSGGRGHLLRYPMKRNSTGGSSRNSRLSSFQHSISAASHDDPQIGPGPSRYMYRAGSSVEHVIPPLHPEDGVTSITVNVVSESESETMVQKQQPPTVVLQQASPHKTTPTNPRFPTIYRNTLRVQPQNVVMALVHSLPDLTFDPTQQPARPQASPPSLTASEKLYQSHQELLERNRRSVQQPQHFLTPNHRGTSYPPPSPTRASLKRGLAFSYSTKNPPLSKMGHVYSQSQLHPDAAAAGPATSGTSTKHHDPGPSTSGESKKHFDPGASTSGESKKQHKESKKPPDLCSSTSGASKKQHEPAPSTSGGSKMHLDPGPSTSGVSKMWRERSRDSSTVTGPVPGPSTSQDNTTSKQKSEKKLTPFRSRQKSSSVSPSGARQADRSE